LPDGALVDVATERGFERCKREGRRELLAPPL